MKVSQVQKNTQNQMGLIFTKQYTKSPNQMGLITKNFLLIERV